MTEKHFTIELGITHRDFTNFKQNGQNDDSLNSKF